MDFSKQHESYSIHQILDWNKTGKLNLNPGFQRASVWTEKDQRMLVDSVLRGMPLPNLFFWERKEGNKIVYDVIDGKQRVEAILAFTRTRMPLAVKFDPESDAGWEYQEEYPWTWKEIAKYEKTIFRRFLSYELPVVIVKGSLPDVEQVFIRINATGKMLTPQEIRHAKWYSHSELLLTAESIAKTKKYEKYFTEMGILSEGQLTRMKATELITEFMLTIEKQDVLDRKKSLDTVMGNRDINRNTVARLGREVKSTLDTIKNVFPELPTSRFTRSGDFYAIFFSIWKMRRDGYHFKDKSAAKLAFAVLNQLGLELSEYRNSFKKGERKVLRSPAREYHGTIIEGTDTARHRRERVKIIDSIIMPIFPKKDSKRLFTQEQKQLLWHSAKDKCCRSCRQTLTWKDVRMDHILAFSKGGRASLKNAQILCDRCNKVKSDN